VAVHQAQHGVVELVAAAGVRVRGRRENGQVIAAAADEEHLVGGGAAHEHGRAVGHGVIGGVGGGGDGRAAPAAGGRPTLRAGRCSSRATVWLRPVPGVSFCR
jgi:hypothetical protein